MEFIHRLLIETVFAADPTIGTIPNPLPLGDVTSGLVVLLNNILRLFIVIAGLYAFFNFIFAGFKFISAAGDSKKISSAWSQIWQSLVGLLIIVCSFLIAAIVGFLFFGNPNFILRPMIYGP